MKCTDLAPAVLGPYSWASTLENGVCTQIPLNLARQVKGRDICEQVVQDLKAVLEAAASSLTKVLKANWYLSDISHFVQFDAVCSQYLYPPFTAGTCFTLRDPPKGAIAYR